jgi:hypothetical protein
VYARFDASADAALDALHRRYAPIPARGPNPDPDPPSDAETALSRSSRVRRIVQDGTWTKHCIVSQLGVGRGASPMSSPPAPLLQVVLADTAWTGGGGGSSSPGMSRAVMRHARSDAWDRLAAANRRAVAAWQRLAELEPSLAPAARSDLLDALATRTSEEWDQLSAESADAAAVDPNVRRLVAVITDLARELKAWRSAMKQLGDRAGVELEPAEQGRVADLAQALPGVVAAVVPGAGGRDAVACLHVNVPRVRRRIVETWSSAGVNALDVRIVPFGEGARIEDGR